MTEENRVKVFICHATEDKPRVRDLCRQLRDDGFAPWLDESDLLPGQDWKHEITRTLTEADAIIVCLTKAAVQKRGFVQTEIRMALEVASEIPDGQVFVIPTKLEPCEPPQQLLRFHFAELFHEDGYTQLKSSLLSIASARRLWVQTPDDESAPAKDPETLQTVRGKMATTEVVESLQAAANLLSEAAENLKSSHRLQLVEEACLLSRSAWAHVYMHSSYDRASDPRILHQVIGAFHSLTREVDKIERDKSLPNEDQQYFHHYAESIRKRTRMLELFVHDGADAATQAMQVKLTKL